MEYKVDKLGDTTITVRNIKIRNIKEWEKVKKDDLTESKAAVKPTEAKVDIDELLERKSTVDWSRRKTIALDGMLET